MAVKFGKAFGMAVTVISSSPGKREEAIQRLGADEFLVMLSYDPKSVSQEKGRLLTERSGGPSPVGLGRSEADQVMNTKVVDLAISNNFYKIHIWFSCPDQKLFECQL
jgi:D-arabinose 1-dehydrogenase-like Zn-dependent alcohol dehydrogenase